MYLARRPAINPDAARCGQRALPSARDLSHWPLFQPHPQVSWAAMVDIRSVTREELQARFSEWGQPPYRVDQLLDWLYARRVSSWSAMSNLPKALREQL